MEIWKDAGTQDKQIIRGGMWMIPFPSDTGTFFLGAFLKKQLIFTEFILKYLRLG